jgi:hypothetical protein
MAIVGSVLSVTVPAAGAALVLLATVSAFGDLTGGFLLVRRLTGRRASQNVSSPEGGDKPGTVVLTAHYDAGRGGAIFGRRVHDSPVGPFAVFFWSMFVVLLCTIPRLAGFEGMGLTVVQFIPTVILIASVPLLVDVALSGPVRAANDNASGVATVLRLAERYGGRLEHFDVWVVFPGADEALLLGTREWLRGHKRELDPELTVFLNVEAAGAGTVRWMEKDGLVFGLRYHPTLVELCKDIGEGRGIRSREGTTALAARAAGFPAITIGARNARDYAPDQVDGDALELTYDFCCALLERLDESIGPELA